MKKMVRELELEKPRLVRDWVGGFVRANREITNGYARMPAGTVYKITNAGMKLHFESMPCQHCGIVLRFTISGKNKLDGFEWLGYQNPGHDR